jgi:DNA-binding MarR family transcriptional regulator
VRPSPARPSSSAGPPADASPGHLVPHLLNLLANRVNQAWRESLRPHGLTVSRWQVLSILSAYDGMRVTEIARMAAQEQPVASRVIGQMERDGLVTRRRSGDDARATEVWLTEAGRAVFGALLPEAGAFVDRLLGRLSDAETSALTGSLTRLLATLDQPDSELEEDTR